MKIIVVLGGTMKQKLEVFEQHKFNGNVLHFFKKSDLKRRNKIMEYCEKNHRELGVVNFTPKGSRMLYNFKTGSRK